MHTYQSYYRDQRTGVLQRVTIEAESVGEAQRLLEAIYGKLTHLPTVV